MNDPMIHDDIDSPTRPWRAGINNLVTRYRQWLMLSGVLLAIVAGFMLLSRSDDDRQAGGAFKLKEPSHFSRVDDVDAEVIWIESAEERLNSIEERLKTTLQENAALQNKNKTIQSEITQVIDDAKHTIERQAKIIESYESGASALTPTPQNDDSDPFAAVSDIAASRAGTPASNDPFNAGANGAGATTPPPSMETDPLTIQQSLVTFELTPQNISSEASIAGDRLAILDVKDYLPAGAYAPGVIIAGAATQVSVTGQADPKPVLIRITGDALSAATGAARRLKIDIRGCTITGEARGEISSERVYVRLQRMTCERDDGVIETNVKGYVSGSGQAGVRGDVISREGDLLDKSFTAGILSGFGNAVSQGLTPNSLNQGGNTRLSDADLIENAGKAGLGKGIGNAGEKLSDYYIRRAEQYQPVVMLKGGTAVQVVFLEGVRIDGGTS